MNKIIEPSKGLKGSPQIPGDKSISHRSLIFGALAEGVTQVQGLLRSDDVFSTLSCLKQMGVSIKEEDKVFVVHGVGLHGLKAPSAPLDCGNSGTTMRLLAGVLAGQNFHTELIGDESLSKRPMKRVADPLIQMGADIQMRESNYPPVIIQGAGELTATHYALPVASAQVKSALLLAALYAKGPSLLTGKIQSRDHTERMLQYMEVELKADDSSISIQGGQALRAKDIQVPSDPSTAAFWAAAAALVPQSEITMENILLNPSRIGLFECLKKMGADIQFEILAEKPEPIGRVQIKHSALRGIDIGEEQIPSLIDEIPLIAILASQAQGPTRVRGAEELRVKESDRIAAVVKNLRSLRVEIEEHEDGFTIHGPQEIGSGKIESFHDHRIAMAFSIAGLVAQGPVEIGGASVVSVSYPQFYEDLQALSMYNV